MADILNYQGNAGLAFGSGGENAVADVGVYNFDPVVASLQNLAKRRNEVQDAEYRQKIADRDALFKKFANMEVALDKARPEYRDKLKEKITQIEKIYLQNPDILSNPEAYLEMQKGLRDFNELHSYSSANFATDTKDMLEAANTEDPDDRAKRLAHIEAQRKMTSENPYAMYEPYKKELGFNLDKMAPVIPPEKKVLKQGADYQDETVTYVDPNKLIDRYRADVLEGPNRSIGNMFDELTRSYGLKTPEERVRDFREINAKVDAANKYLPEGSKLKHIEYDDKTGIVDPARTTKDDFNKAIIIGLRFQEKTATEFNKGRADAAKAKADIYQSNAAGQAALIRAGTDRLYKGVLGAAAAKKAEAYSTKLQQTVRGAKTQEEVDAILDKSYNRNITNQEKLLIGKGNNKVSIAYIQPDKSLPLYTVKDAKGPEQLIPIGGKPIYDRYETDKKGKQIPAKTAKILYYEGGHFEPIYMYGGRQLSIDKIGELYRNFKADNEATWSGTMDDWMKKAVERKKFEVLIKGANGTTDRKLSLAAQRIIGNKNTKKGQEGVFEPPDDEQPVGEAAEPE